MLRGLIYEDGVTEGAFLSTMLWLILHFVAGQKGHKWKCRIAFYATIAGYWLYYKKQNTRESRQVLIWLQSIFVGGLIAAIPQFMLEEIGLRRRK